MVGRAPFGSPESRIARVAVFQIQTFQCDFASVFMFSLCACTYTEKFCTHANTYIHDSYSYTNVITIEKQERDLRDRASEKERNIAAIAGLTLGIRERPFCLVLRLYSYFSSVCGARYPLNCNEINELFSTRAWLHRFVLPLLIEVKSL